MAVVGFVSAEVHETMILDKNYVGTFKVGKEKIKMIALLNLEATVVNSLTCGQCETKVYNISGANQTAYQNYTFLNPLREQGNVEYEALPLIESLCIYDAEDTQICTPNTDSVDDDYTMLILERYI